MLDFQPDVERASASSPHGLIGFPFWEHMWFPSSHLGSPLHLTFGAHAGEQTQGEGVSPGVS